MMSCEEALDPLGLASAVIRGSVVPGREFSEFGDVAYLLLASAALDRRAVGPLALSLTMMVVVPSYERNSASVEWSRARK